LNLGSLTRDHLRDAFQSWSAIRELGAIRVGIPGIPVYQRAVSARAPQIDLVTLRQSSALFDPVDDLAAYVLSAERGSVFTLLHPAYSVVVPQPDRIKVPVACPVARSDERWVTFINTWIELKRRDGTIQALYRHWVLGERPASTARRWSLLRDVFGWGN
jgi:hypothetical protein